MQIHTLIQGSPEWHAYRAKHFNASDAPAMMGASPYKSRSELLHERFTGMAKDVDAATQKRFDDGHRFENLAQPLAEEIVGQGLYPVVGSEGKYSASFDGLTMLGDIAFEHKSINDELRLILVRAGVTGADLPEHYQVQMEQQLMVSSAERCLFMASKFDANDQLIECMHCWYEPDGFLRKRIVDGWSQFEKDLADYQPRQLAEKPPADAILQLPTLVVQTRGEVVNSNLPAYKAAAEAFIAAIKTDLATDQDFADAEATVKFCGQAEAALEQAKAAALAQTASIDDLMRTVDQIQAQLRSKRLALTKLVDSKKTEIKNKILADGKQAYAAHVTALNAEIAPLQLQLAGPDFVAAMKNKRTLESLHNAVDTALAAAKIAADAQAAEVRAKLAWFRPASEGYGLLFFDLQQLIGKPSDDFQLAVNSRIQKQKDDDAAKLAAEQQKQREQEAAAQLAVTTQPSITAVTHAIDAAVPTLSIGNQNGALPAASPNFMRAAPAFNPAGGTGRPTDAHIVGLIATHWRISERTVIDWLRTMKLAAYLEALEA